MGEWCIPTVDLSPFCREDDEDGRKKARDTIGRACSEYGFFQVVNHGVPLGLMTRAIELSRTFFETLPNEEKLKCAPNSGTPLPAGYNRQPDRSPDKNEYLLMFPPSCNLNVYPQNPPHFREILEQIFAFFTRLGEVIESILSQCLGLPSNFLEEFNHDRSWDFMVALHYFPATETENNGITEHEDGNCITFVLQDEAGGLEVRRNGEWIPVIPTRGSLVVNVGDVIQKRKTTSLFANSIWAPQAHLKVLSNNNFKSATHRVVRPKSKSRYSYAFFYNLHGDKWVEPLHQFTKDIGEVPRYRGFLYKEYQELRMRNKTHPPSTPEDVIHITHYAINTS